MKNIQIILNAVLSKNIVEYILVDKETEDGMGTAIPEEKRTLKLENNTYVLATRDIDEKIIIDEGNIKIEETNNYAKSDLIVFIIYTILWL